MRHSFLAVSALNIELSYLVWGAHNHMPLIPSSLLHSQDGLPHCECSHSKRQRLSRSAVENVSSQGKSAGMRGGWRRGNQYAISAWDVVRISCHMETDYSIAILFVGLQSLSIAVNKEWRARMNFLSIVYWGYDGLNCSLCAQEVDRQG
jgi:hypothetical protein